MTGSDFVHLLGTTVAFDDGTTFRLDRPLGGGATAVVFEGIYLDGSKRAAIKVARPEAQWQEALKREWRNLHALDQAQQGRAAHYFPSLLHPAQESSLALHIAGQPYLVMAQELVTGQGTHDLLLEYPDLRLPEPLALEIGCQYADMLTILHAANLTCADRKLPDLRWHKAYDLRPETPTALARWAESSPGQLIVLDWNVTGTATPAEVALDLFRFGLLWHRLLLGVEPRFRSGAGWQLEEPLAKHPVWPALSFGARQILERLLHPLPEQRYHTAKLLRQKLQTQRRYWQTEAGPLINAIEPVFRQWIEKKTMIPERINDALAMADTLRVRVESWGEPRPDSFDSIHRALRRAVFDAPFAALRSAANMRQWDETDRVISQVEKEYTDDPACRLYLDRQRAIVNLARQSRVADATKSLFDQSELIFIFDRPSDEPDAQGNRLNDAGLAEWRAARDNEPDPAWQQLRTDLINQGDYRLNVERARACRDNGDYAVAANLFDHLTTLRAGWQEQKERVEWLDRLYGDPTGEHETVKRILTAGQNAQDVLQQVLQAVVDGTVEADKPGQESEVTLSVVEKVRRILRAQPDLLFGRLALLLTAAQSYHRVKSTHTLTRLYHLHRLEQGWQEMLKIGGAQPAGAAVTGEQEQLMADFFQQQKLEITLGVVDRLAPLAQLELTSRPNQMGQGINNLPVVLFIKLYREYFAADDNFKSQLQETFFQPVRDMLEIFLNHAPDDNSDRYEQQFNQYYQTARLAEAIAGLAELHWPDYTGQLQQKRQEKQAAEKFKTMLKEILYY